MEEIPMIKSLFTALVLTASLSAFAQQGARTAAPQTQTVVTQAEANVISLGKTTGLNVTGLLGNVRNTGSGFAAALGFAANDPIMTAPPAALKTALSAVIADSKDGVADYSGALRSVGPNGVETFNKFALKIVQGSKDGKKPQALVMANVLYPSCGANMANDSDIKGAQACFAAACSK
jgi:hypothetical protein